MTRIEFTKQELKSLKKYGVDIESSPLLSQERARGKEIGSLLFLSNGNKELHESGYPLIKIIGIGKNKTYFDLGWHDHFICHIPINIDSFGKNIFHIMPWTNRDSSWKVSELFIPCSTFEISEGGKLR